MQDFAGGHLGGRCVEGTFGGEGIRWSREVCKCLVFSGIHGCAARGEQMTVITVPDYPTLSSRHKRELPRAEGGLP